MRYHLRTFAALSLLTLGACGSGSTTDAAGAPDSVPFASTSTTADSGTVPATVPSAVADPSSTTVDPATGSAGAPAAGSEVSVELINSMLATEEGRALIAETMAEQSGITQEQAVCFLENIDAGTMVALSELGASGATTPDPSALPDTALGDLMDAVTTCGIDPVALLG